MKSSRKRTFLKNVGTARTTKDGYGEKRRAGSQRLWEARKQPGSSPASLAAHSPAGKASSVFRRNSWKPHTCCPLHTPIPNMNKVWKLSFWNSREIRINTLVVWWLIWHPDFIWNQLKHTSMRNVLDDIIWHWKTHLNIGGILDFRSSKRKLCFVPACLLVGVFT